MIELEHIQVHPLFPGLRTHLVDSYRRILLVSRGAVGAAPYVLSAPPGHRMPANADLEGAAVLLSHELETGLIRKPFGDPAFSTLLPGLRPVSFPVDRGVSARLLAIVTELSAELDLKEPAHRAAALAKVLELLVALTRLRSKAGSNPGAHDVWTMSDVVRYVQTHFDQSFSLEEIASRCAMSQGSFTREFKQDTGSPLFEFINKVRIRKACELLKQSTKSVMEIAIDVGYNNVSFFNRYFRRIMGMSPTSYRSMARR